MSDGPLGELIKLIWPVDFPVPVGSVPEASDCQPVQASHAGGSIGKHHLHIDS